MRFRFILTGVALLGLLLAAGFYAREMWLPASSDSDEHYHAHGPVADVQRIRLSAQARANMGLVVKPLKVDSFWRTIQVPGLIVDRPAHSDRGVVAPTTGVVSKVHQFPGDTVRPGEKLFTLKLLSEMFLFTQSELFKANQETQIVSERKKRFSELFSTGGLAQTQMIEVENELNRLKVKAQVYRQELQTRGLTPEQIDNVAEGRYVREIEVNAPKQSTPDRKLLAGSLVNRQTVPSDATEVSYEVQELKVELGQQVQAGQTMCLLSNHQSLYIEGRAFRQETSLLEKAVKEGWPIQVDFMEGEASCWPTVAQTFTIRHIANTIDTTSRTFAFYVPLHNQARSVDRDGRTLMLWRYRPGQKVRLHVRVEKLDDVFVLPAEAVVREGPEAYVFRQSGSLFDRRPVRVVHQDRQHVVIANDGSVPAGLFVAQNGAVQINRVLKSQSGGLPPGFHMHADGSIHSNSAH